MIRNGFHYTNKPTRGATVDRSHPLSRGLITALLFNEGTGNTVYDATGSGGDVTGVASPTWAAGRDGHTGSISAQLGQYYSNTTLPFPSSNLTIVTIARVTTTNNNSSIIGQPVADTQGGTGYFNLYYTYGGTIYWRFGSSPDITYTPPTSFFGTWHHAAFTSSPTANGLYMDGVLKTSGGGGSRTVGNPGFTLGSWSGYLFGGQISQTLIYNRVLSAAEIAWLNEENYAFMTPPTVRRFYSLPSGVVVPGSYQGGLAISPQMQIGI
jgi:hypothetical protein